MICISTLVVQLIIALFHGQIVYAVHASVRLHAGVLPAVVQGTLDQLGETESIPFSTEVLLVDVVDFIVGSCLSGTTVGLYGVV